MGTTTPAASPALAGRASRANPRRGMAATTALSGEGGTVSTWNAQGPLVHHVASKVSNARTFSQNDCSAIPTISEAQYNQQAEAQSEMDYVSFPED